MSMEAMRPMATAKRKPSVARRSSTTGKSNCYLFSLFIQTLADNWKTLNSLSV